MSIEKYSVTQYNVSAILGFIKGGDIAIPEIQRPFVWKKKQVRDLIDSLYYGYPTGYLIIWQNPNIKLKSGGSSHGKKILIDGQQRVTALMAAILGQEIVDENYQTTRIKIAFNPTAENDEERFAVQDSSHIKSKKWIEDISVVFKPGFSTFSFISEYTKDNEIDPDKLNDILIKLKSIENRQIGVVELNHSLDIDEVTEIFIRINSQGKPLGQADFAMSKIAADEKYGGNLLRKSIDYFCHLAVKPEYYDNIANHDVEFMKSEFAPKIKWLRNDKDDIYDPDYGDMLRVSFMHRFSRGKIADLVSLLSGRNFETREYNEEIAEESFGKLKEGVLSFINEYNFTNFVQAIKTAGYESSQLINSQMTLDFAYTVYLMLASSPDITKTQIKRYVQKWYVLSVLTGRYVSSPETAMDQDIRNFKSKGYQKYFEEIESAVLSDTFWNVGLVQNLETSAINSPYFVTFLAAQNYLGDNSLFLKGTKIGTLITMMGDIHHIFPKGYLKKFGIEDRAIYNQVANYTYLDTQLNIAIAEKAPIEYFGTVKAQCLGGELLYGNIQDEKELKKNLDENCIPSDIYIMEAKDYQTFLLKRRQLMAKKIKKYYSSL